MNTLDLIAIPCLADNYAWLLRDPGTGTVAIVDPGEAAPIEQALAARGWGLDLILLTHHHADHVDGVLALKAAHGAAVLGPAADSHRLPALDRGLHEGDKVAVGNATGVVIDTPGHTVGHIAFYFATDALLLCGDTLFSLGCGRLFEGSAADLYASLRKFAALPPETRIACGHEYTLSNGRFALSVDPDNAALKARMAEAEADRAAGQPTLPALLGEEMQTNPYLRAPDVETVAKLRAAKDNF